MKTELTHEEVLEYFENMARQSMSKHGREHPHQDSINAFVIGAMCSTIAILVSGGEQEIENLRRRMQ